MDSDLSRDAKHIGKTLFLHVSPAGDAAVPYVATIARECSLGVRTVQYGLRELESNKWITWELRGFSKWKWAARQYRLRYPEGEIATLAPQSEVHTPHPRRCAPRTPQDERHREVKLHAPNPISGEMGDWFEKLFAAYPNQQAKDRAWRKVQHMAPDAALRDEITEGLARWRRYADLKSAPFLSTWLRNGTWREARTKRIPGLCSACGNVAVVGDGRDYWCGAHDPDRRPA